MPEIVIRSDNRSGDKENIIARHRILYETEFGFNSDFGDYVEESLNDQYERIWIAECDGKFAGCIGLVVVDSTAQLRWFLVEPRVRGMNIGRQLLKTLIGFCKERNYSNIFLWTVDELHAARKLYEEFGFSLTETLPKRFLWGKSITEQRWDLSLEPNR
jgi:GNAT superfamily N-acetyltransferase